VSIAEGELTTMPNTRDTRHLIDADLLCVRVYVSVSF
jgi:hypothetical protein